MSLPTKDEISQAIERQGTLKVPTLADFSPIEGILGPESYAGGFCIAFPFQKGNVKKAVRVWHQEIGNIKERYNLIAADIHKHGSPYLCDVEFIEGGLDVDGTLIDIVIMDWIDGLPLKKYIQSIYDSNQNNEEKAFQIKELAKKLLEMFDYFHRQKFSHGDLQHDNIIITETGEVKVIDYDCFYTPSLGNGFQQTTSGYKGYQHPSRFLGQIVSNEKADYFSELIIYLSLYAISEKLALWDIAKDSDFSFLFSEEDFGDITNSQVYKDIQSLGGIFVDLLDVLVDYLKESDIDSLHPFREYLLEKKITFKSSATKAIRKKQAIKVFWQVPFEADVTLEQKGIPNIEKGNQGSINVVLDKDADFELTIISKDGIQIKKCIRINVFDECAIDFSSDKKYVFPSLPVVLRWNVANANKVWLNSEEVVFSGSKIVEPTSDTVYTLQAEDEFGVKEGRITIHVMPIKQMRILLASPPNFTIKQSFSVMRPKYNVGVKFPTIDIGWIKLEVPKVKSLKDLGLDVELSPPLPPSGFSLRNAIKRAYNNIIRK